MLQIDISNAREKNERTNMVLKKRQNIPKAVY